MRDELKPCPFCGDEYPDLIKDAWIYYVQYRKRVTCGAEAGRAPNESHAISKWNRRANERDDESGSGNVARMLTVND